MSIINCLTKMMRKILRKAYNSARWKLIKVTRLIGELFGSIKNNEKIVLLNLQYVNAFTEVEMLCGQALRQKGYNVKVIICPGLDYCEREDYQTERPSCEECRKESLKICSAYGFDVLKTNNDCEKQSGTSSNKLKTPLNELVYRNYLHYKKSFTELDYPTWKRIKKSVITFCDYITNLDCDFAKVEKVITANGRFFQTAIPIEIIETKSGFVTTEVFSDRKIVFGRNTFSLNNELEVDEKGLQLLEYDRSHAENFVRNEGRTNDGGIQVWGDDRIDDVEVLKRELNVNQYTAVLAFFPNVMWDSTWFGLGHFCHSPASFIAILNNVAKKFPDVLFVIRAHPGEKNVPSLMESSAPIFSDLTCQHIKFEKNIKFINAENAFSSYKIAEIADFKILWNGTLGLEFAAKGLGCYSIADSYYEKFGVICKINNISELEKILDKRDTYKLTETEIDIANRILYTSRNAKRIRSPIHKNTFCTKFLWSGVSSREHNFIRFFPDYFEENISIYELHDALDK